MIEKIKKYKLRPAVSPLFIFTVSGIFIVCDFPQIRHIFDSFEPVRHIPHWDGLNHLIWQYEAYMGWLPFKDLFYPYSGYYGMQGILPWSMAAFFFYKFSVFFAFLISTHILLNRSAGWTLFLLIVILFFTETGFIEFPWRYFMSLDIVLCYLALQRLKKPNSFHFALYGIFLWWAFYIGPPQLVYGGVPVCVQITLNFIRRDDKRRRIDDLKKLFATAAAFLSLVMVYFALLAYRGQFFGFIEHYVNLKFHAIIGSIPTDLNKWYQFSFAPENLAQISILFFLYYGAYLTFHEKKQAELKGADIFLSIGLLGLMIFIKQLVRPHMARQFIGVFFVGFFFFLFYWSRFWSPIQKKIGLFLVLLSLGFTKADWDPIRKKYFTSDRIGNFGRNVSLVLTDKAEAERKQADYFSPESFQRYKGAKKFHKYYEKYLKGSKFYILGDNAYFYAIARQKPPFYLTFYDGAALHAQKRIVNWLEKNNIDLIIWDSSYKSFDRTPNIVRVPLIYDYVIRHYKPRDAFGEFLVLEKKQADDVIDVEFWKNNLGNSIDLGHLPGISSIGKTRDCALGETTECLSFLEVSLSGSDQKTSLRRVVEFRAEEHDFKIYFQQNKKDGVYYIFLDRIWFWGALKKEGLNPALKELKNGHAHVKVVYKSPKEDFLY